MPAASDRTSGQALPSLPHTWRPMGVRFAVVGFGLMRRVVGAAACSRFFFTVSTVRSSATRRAPSWISLKARSDLPEPLSPRSRMPCVRMATQLA